MKKSWHQFMRRAPKAARTDENGNTFDSAGELRRWRELQLLERGKVISNLRRQVRFPLILPNGVPVLIRSKGFPGGRQAVYTADYAYIENGVEVVEDFKSKITASSPDVKLRIALFEAINGIRVRISGDGSAVMDSGAHYGPPQDNRGPAP